MRKDFGNSSQSVLTSTLMLTFSSLLLQVLGFAYRIILSRMLSAEQMGVYGLMMPVYALLSAGTLSGFSVAAVRTTADFAGNAAALRRRASAVLHMTLRLYALLFCAVTVVFSLFSGNIAALLGERGLQTALLLLLPCLLMTAFENILKSVFQGIQNVVPSMVSECTEQLVRIVSVAILLYITDSGAGKNGTACAVVVCGMMISEVASDLILGAFAGDILHRKGGQKGLGKAILRCALPVCAGNACGMLLSSISGAVVPAALRGYGLSASQALSEYGELSGMLLPLLGIPGAFVYPLNTVMLPRLTEALAAGNKAAFRRRVRKTLLSVALIACCTEGAAVVLSPKLCALCFGTAYPAGSGAIVRLGIASLAGFVAAGAGCVLNAMKKQGTLVVTGIALGVAEIPLLMGAIRESGLSGYADVSVVLGILQMAVLLYMVGRYVREP